MLLGYVRALCRVMLLPVLIFEVFHLEHQLRDEIDHGCMHAFISFGVDNFFGCGCGRNGTMYAGEGDREKES